VKVPWTTRKRTRPVPTIHVSRFVFLLVRCFVRRFEKAIIANAKQNVTLDVLSYHASASLEDAQKLRVSTCINVRVSTSAKNHLIARVLQALQVPSAVTYNLYDFSFDDIHMSDDDTLLVSICYRCS